MLNGGALQGDPVYDSVRPFTHQCVALPVVDSSAIASSVPTEGLAYWVLKNSWGPAFGEGGYARLLFGNNCLRGVTQPYLNKSGVVEARE